MRAKTLCGAALWFSALVSAFALGAAVWPSPSQAGDRRLEALFVRADEGDDPESERCMTQMRAAARRTHGYVSYRSIGREVFLERIQATSTEGLVAWPRERFAGAFRAHSERGLDALVVMDCRPTQRRLDLVVLNSVGPLPAEDNTQRLSLRDVELDAATLNGVGALVSVWQARGFTY